MILLLFYHFFADRRSVFHDNFDDIDTILHLLGRYFLVYNFAFQHQFSTEIIDLIIHRIGIWHIKHLFKRIRINL